MSSIMEHIMHVADKTTITRQNTTTAERGKKLH